ncbi:hypothetical protein MMC28_010298 [Mycoblastus sanguinarius]|nr:hypothetical protein [Mycoblastus sanguinarius]
MHSQIIVLLAVFSNLIVAGLVRHRTPIQHSRFARFSNQSTIASNFDAPQTSTSIMPSSSSLSYFTEPISETSISDLISSPTPIDRQFASVQALGDSSQATTSDTGLSAQSISVSTVVSQTSVQSPLLSTTASFLSMVRSAPNIGGAAAVVTPSAGSTLIAFNLAPTNSREALSTTSSQLSESTQPTDATETQIAAPITALATSSAPEVQIPQSNTYEWAPVTAASTLSAASAYPTYPTAQDGNVAMAVGFNQIYKTLSEVKPCNPSDDNQLFACVEGELAQCQADGLYTLKSCPQGQSCYALPMPSGKTGISVQCAVPSDAASQLAGTSSLPASSIVNSAASISSPSASLTVNTMTAASQPGSTFQSSSKQNAETTQESTTGNLQTESTTYAVPTIASFPSVQATIHSPEVTTPSTNTLTSTAAQTGISSPIDETVASDATSAASSTAAQSSPAAGDAPLIVSFPDALTSSTPSHGEQQTTSSSTPPPDTSTPTPKAQVPALQDSIPAPQIFAAPAPQSVPTPNNSPLTEPAPRGTSTSSADSAGITIVPLDAPGVNEKVAANGFITVTVTYTTTARDGNT